KCPKYIEIKKTLEKMAHSNLTFQEAKNQIKKNSDVDQVSVHQDVQEGITAAPLQVTTARTYAATCTTTATNKIPAAQQHAHTQTDPLDQTVADSDSEMREGEIVSAPPQRCGCHGEKNKFRPDRVPYLGSSANF